MMRFICSFHFHFSFDNYISSSVKWLLRAFAHFKIGLFLFLFLSFKSSLHILETSPLLDIWFKYISSVACLFIFLTMPFTEQSYNVNKVQLLIFFFCRLCVWCFITKYVTKNKSCNFSLFSSKSFKLYVLYLVLWYLFN